LQAIEQLSLEERSEFYSALLFSREDLKANIYSQLTPGQIIEVLENSAEVLHFYKDKFMKIPKAKKN
jgi:hypothetical protein